MKPLLLVLIYLISFSVVFSQENVNKAQALNQQMAALYGQGKLDEAISVGEQILKIQKEEKSPNPQNLITSLENLGQIKLTRFKKNMAELVSPNLNSNKLKNVLEKMNQDGKETEDIFREALSLAKNHPRTAPEQLAGLQNNLAWLLYKFFPSEANLPVGFDKQKKDLFDSLNKTRFYGRINEAENLYTEALKNSETVFGGNSDITLLSSYNFAEFQLATGNFESAIPLYEKCIGIVEKKYGENSQDLILPLESYTKALIATNQKDLAKDVINRISKISGKPIQAPRTLLNISLRADKSFITTNSPTVERKEQANSEKAYMSSQGSIILSGATGEASGTASLLSSTFGKSYYDNSQAIKIVRIPVRVLIDENGKPIEVEGLTNDKDYKAAAEKTVSEWKFRPFNRSGQSKRLNGYVECLFLAEKFTN